MQEQRSWAGPVRIMCGAHSRGSRWFGRVSAQMGLHPGRELLELTLYRQAQSAAPSLSSSATAAPGPEIRDVARVKETAGYARYVRCCGRTGAARPPLPRFPAGCRWIALPAINEGGAAPAAA